MARTRPTLRYAIEWIAFNDDDSVLDLQAIEQSITVALVADLFGKSPEQIAQQVQERRERREADKGEDITRVMSGQ